LASHVVLNLVQFIQSSKIMVKEFCSKVPSDRVGKLSTEGFFYLIFLYLECDILMLNAAYTELGFI
jgi:hypothetical protein